MTRYAEKRFQSLGSSVRMLAFAVAGLFCAGAAGAMQVDGEAGPTSVKAAERYELRHPGFAPGGRVELTLPRMVDDQVKSVREYNMREGNKPLQIGVERDLTDFTKLDRTPELNWARLADGSQVTQLAVSSEGAEALRVGLRVKALPATAELRFVAPGQTRSVVEVVSGTEVKYQLTDSLYWTPVSPGARQIIELWLPSNASVDQVELSVDRVAHMLVSPYGDIDLAKIGESGPCQIDANCVSNPSNAFLLAKSAVARMSFQNGGSFVCTGTQLNDTVPSSFIPYFFSANHCISTQAVANTLVTFWFEESTSCGSGVAGPRTQVSGGAALLYNNPNTDALLLRLNNPAPSGAGFSGWDATPVAAGTLITVIHHPAGDVKKVSQGQTTGFGTYQGVGSFIRAGYTQGSTEGGSSGAGLLTFANSQYSLRGGLYGGSASCSNSGNISTPANTDAFSRFDLDYPNIQQFLSPGGAGTQSLTVVRAGNGTGTVTSSPAGINCGATCSAGFASGAQVILTATPASGSTFAGFTGCDSVAGSACSVTINAARSVTATFNGSGGGGGSVLQNGVAVTGISGGLNSTTFYTFTIPAGATNLNVQTSGAAGNTGDPDLYVRFGAPPTTEIYDCRGFDTGPAGLCSFANPAAGTWHVMIHGFTAYSGLNLTASWQVSSGGGSADEPQFSNFTLPIPVPPFASCPFGYFTANVEDGPGPGVSPGIFGLQFVINPPGTQRLEGGLNFGGLVDGTQAAFAGVNFANPANEQQRLDLAINGRPTGNPSGSLPVRITVIRNPAPGVNETVLELTANLTTAQQFTRSINLNPGFYVVTVAPTGAASQPGGAADGEVFVSMVTQFVNRPGGGFNSGAVVGGYHAVNPFGGVSGFAAICLGSQHTSNARVFSAPTYGPTGARDLRIRVVDYLQREVIRTPQ